MNRKRLLFAVLLVAGAFEVARTQTAQVPSCDFCPVAGVQPKATKPFAVADTSHGCTFGTKRGFPVPDPKCTPGAVNPTVTQAVLQNKDYRTGCVRNCISTESEKDVTYRWYAVPHPSDNEGPNQVCELDHLVPLELGGADSLDNIWPQCGPNSVALDQRYFKHKDMVENFLANQVKTGKLPLEKVQPAIAKDWTQFLSKATDFCKKNPTKCPSEQ